MILSLRISSATFLYSSSLRLDAHSYLPSLKWYCRAISRNQKMMRDARQRGTTIYFSIYTTGFVFFQYWWTLFYMFSCPIVWVEWLQIRKSVQLLLMTRLMLSFAESNTILSSRSLSERNFISLIFLILNNFIIFFFAEEHFGTKWITININHFHLNWCNRYALLLADFAIFCCSWYNNAYQWN